MNESSGIDLSRARVVDVHCHGFGVDSILASDPEKWLNRITLMGTCFESSGQGGQDTAALADGMTGSTLLALAARRWLAALLGCGEDMVAQTRAQAMAQDIRGYLSRLFKDENLSALFVDDGYPQPPVDLARMGRDSGLTIHRVVRIEPLIERARKQSASLAALEENFRALLDRAASDPNTTAFKSIIAYRTGLDIDTPDHTGLETDYRRWRESGWKEERSLSKAVRDHLLNVALDIAGQRGLPFHLHTGGGDPDVKLGYANPIHLEKLLKQRLGQAIVLIHAGYPWLGETAYLASLYPLVYVDLSVASPWSTLYLERGLETLLGAVPAQKLMHGSDEASLPEVIWLAARLTRQALQRVLARAVDMDLIDTGQAEHIGRGVLAENAPRPAPAGLSHAAGWPIQIHPRKGGARGLSRSPDKPVRLPLALGKHGQPGFRGRPSRGHQGGAGTGQP